MDINGMTAEEQSAAAIANPREFWAGVHAHAVEGFKSVRSRMTTDLSRALNFYLTHFETIIETQSLELSYLREIETGIRNQTLSEEQLKGCLSLLDGLRAEVQAKAAAGKSS